MIGDVDIGQNKKKMEDRKPIFAKAGEYRGMTSIRHW